MPSATQTARLEARISTEPHAMLKRAAEIQGRTMTDFIISAVQDAAQRAIEQTDIIRLSRTDQEILLRHYCHQQSRTMRLNGPLNAVIICCTQNKYNVSTDTI